MNIRTRVALLVGVLVALATAAAGFGSYSVTRSEANATVDDFLAERGNALARIVQDARDGRGRFGDAALFNADGDRQPPDGLPGLGAFLGEGARFGADEGIILVHLVEPDVDIVGDSEIELPPPPSEVGVTLTEFDVDGEPHRMRSEVFADGSTVQIARSLEETESTLRAIRTQLWLLGAGVTIAAVAIGWFGARRLARPLEHLSASAEHVAASGDLSTAFETSSSGEVGRVARSFSAMLATLSESQQQQRQLVADAGHELRTPMTALRTNVELLASGRLTEQDARTALESIKSETGELSKLTGELVELASEAHDGETPTAVDIFDVAEAAAERARRRHDRVVDVSGVPCPIVGQPAQLDRAISNLLDNAAKFSPAGSPIALSIAPDTVSVADQGSGIDPADLDHIFERFHRSDTARTLPGSGLGLAIVAKIAETHGGAPFARNTDVGATVGFTFDAHALADSKD